MAAFSTSQNPGMTAAANSIARIFVGDPKADAAYRDQQIKNSTEMARQKYLAEQTISEESRRQQMQAAAAASNAAANNSNASAGRTNQETKAREDLGAIFTPPPQLPEGVQGPNMPMPTLEDPAIRTRVVQTMLRGGLKDAGPLALLPGNSDQTLGNILTAGGHTIGGDQYVSVNDRNTNNTTNVPDGSRMVNNQGGVLVDVAPNVANGTGGKGGKGGGKIPMLPQDALNSMIRSAITSHGAVLDPKAPLAPYFAAQPELYQNLSKLVAQGWNDHGGNAAAVQDMLAQYLAGQDMSKFGKRTDNRLNPFSDKHIQTVTPAVDINTLLQQGGGVDPNVFTGAMAAPAAAPAPAGLPNRQNVGTAPGWKFLGAQ